MEIRIKFTSDSWKQVESLMVILENLVPHIVDNVEIIEVEAPDSSIQWLRKSDEIKKKKCYRELDEGMLEIMNKFPRANFKMLTDNEVPAITILHGEMKDKIYEAQNPQGLFERNPDFRDGYLEALNEVYLMTYELTYLEAEKMKEVM